MGTFPHNVCISVLVLLAHSRTSLVFLFWQQNRTLIRRRPETGSESARKFDFGHAIKYDYYAIVSRNQHGLK